MQKPIPPIPVVQARSLVAQTIDVLRTRIKSGAWRVGDRLLPEKELADALGVGRNTVREAVRVLSYSRMLEVRQGDGTYVRLSVDPAETVDRLRDSHLRNQLELQRMLESEAAGLAAARRTQEDVSILRDLLLARRDFQAGDPFGEFIERDRAFHLAIVHAAHNDALVGMYVLFAESIASRLPQMFQESAFSEPGLASHEVIVDAIEAGDTALAASLARATYAPLLLELSGF